MVKLREKRAEGETVEEARRSGRHSYPSSARGATMLCLRNESANGGDRGREEEAGSRKTLYEVRIHTYSMHACREVRTSFLVPSAPSMTSAPASAYSACTSFVYRYLGWYLQTPANVRGTCTCLRLRSIIGISTDTSSPAFLFLPSIQMVLQACPLPPYIHRCCVYEVSNENIRPAAFSRAP